MHGDGEYWECKTCSFGCSSVWGEPIRAIDKHESETGHVMKFSHYFKDR